MRNVEAINSWIRYVSIVVI